MTSTSDLDPVFFGIDSGIDRQAGYHGSDVDTGASARSPAPVLPSPNVTSERMYFQHAGKKYEFNRSIMVDTLKSLKKHANVKIADLTGAAETQFKDVRETFASISSSREILDTVVGDIKTVFGNPSQVTEPGTVSSYLLGCYREGATECDPYCASSVAPFGSKKCSSKVYYVLSAGNITQISSPDTPSWDGTAIVYWAPKVEPVLTPEMLRKVKDANVKTVVNKVLGSNVEHSKLEITGASTNASSESNSTMYMVMMVFLAVLLVALLSYLLFRTYKNNDETTQQ